MWHTTEDIYNMIDQMNRHLRTELLKENGEISKEKLWENTYIKRQIDKREDGGSFSVSDHIRAMVYAMLSGGQSWNKYAKEADSQTGAIPCVDTIFCQYQPTELLSCSPEQLLQELQKIHLAPLYQPVAYMEALIHMNIPKLLEWEEEFGAVDSYYQKYIQEGIDRQLLVPAKPLIETLSDAESENKFQQMGVPLVCEYLRNVGYDLPKPDTHIRRILGSEYLGFHTSREVSEYRSIELMFKIAQAAQKSVAETDYIMWSYCANGFGEICTSSNPKCEVCVAVRQCRKHRSDVVNQIKNKYVLESHYKIRTSDSASEIICKAANQSFQSFCRRVFQGNTASVEDRNKLNHEVELLLADKIPGLLESTDQKVFDEIHHKICEEIIHIYQPLCKQSYGVAQRWLNETLVNLLVIDSALPISILPVMRTRKYFHVPVEQEILRVATAKRKEMYHCGLGLKCAPSKNETSENPEMDWFHNNGDTQSFERWEYEEYIEFQNAVRNALENPIKEGIYKDILDWSLNAFVELS